MKKIKPELVNDNWDSWLSEFESNLADICYKKYNQNYKSESFSYWKSFKIGTKKVYQIGVLFYDFREFSGIIHMADLINITYDCRILGVNNVIDMSCFGNVDVSEFEEMAKDFYNTMKKYN